MWSLPTAVVGSFASAARTRSRSEVEASTTVGSGSATTISSGPLARIASRLASTAEAMRGTVRLRTDVVSRYRYWGTAGGGVSKADGAAFGASAAEAAAVLRRAGSIAMTSTALPSSRTLSALGAGGVERALPFASVMNTSTDRTRTSTRSTYGAFWGSWADAAG